MLRTIKIILYRMIDNKAYLLMPFIITPIIIFFAMYFSSASITNPNIAVVSDKPYTEYNFNNVNIERLHDKVPLSDLVKNKYDAVVYLKDDTFSVDTIKSSKFKKKVTKLFNGEDVKLEDNNGRGAGVNIAGYLSMFILMLGCRLYNFFFQDKKFIAPRIIASNMTYSEYALSHMTAVFIIMFVPTSIVILISKIIFNVNTGGVNCAELIFVIFLLCILSSAFGLLLCSVTDNDIAAKMISNFVIISTSLISGSFFSISNNNIMQKVSAILPQRQLLDLTAAFQNYKNINYLSIIYIFMLTVIFIKVSSTLNKHKIKG